MNGKMIPLNEVQEEDQRNMTTDEYKVTRKTRRVILYAYHKINRLIMKHGNDGKTTRKKGTVFLMFLFSFLSFYYSLPARWALWHTDRHIADAHR